MFPELTLDPGRENDEQFAFERAALAVLWLVSLVALLGYSVASIPSGIIASLVVVVGALLSYDDSTVQGGSMWHWLLLVIVLLNVVFMAYPLVQQEHHGWNVLFIPGVISFLLLGGLVVLGALLVYDATRGAPSDTGRVLLLSMVPLSVFLIAHPLADRANGVPQSLLPVPAGVLLLLVTLWKVSMFPKTHEAPRA